MPNPTWKKICLSGDVVNSDLSGSAGITNDNLASGAALANLGGSGSLSSSVDHDSTNNFAANEHIDHTGVTITAGTGLTGGGTIAATRTLNVIGGTGITANADNITTTDSEIVHDNLSGFVANEHVDWVTTGAATIHTSHYTDTTPTATNVAAAGALMDSECTNLAAVKAFTGEAAATADQTAAEIYGLFAADTSNSCQFGKNVTIDGDLTISGATVTMDVATLAVEDHVITLANGSNGAAAASSAGIEIDTDNGTKQPTIQWTNVAGLAQWGLYQEGVNTSLPIAVMKSGTSAPAGEHSGVGTLLIDTANTNLYIRTV